MDLTRSRPPEFTEIPGWKQPKASCWAHQRLVELGNRWTGPRTPNHPPTPLPSFPASAFVIPVLECALLLHHANKR